jgi:hypothetical protein
MPKSVSDSGGSPHVGRWGLSAPLSLAQLVDGGDPPRGADLPLALPPRLLGPFGDKCIVFLGSHMEKCKRHLLPSQDS